MPILVLVVAVQSRTTVARSPEVSSAASPSPPPAVNPAERAKKSFAALADRAWGKLRDLKPEALPPVFDSDLDFRRGSDIRTDAALRFDILVPMTHDVQTTSSLTAPFRGTFEFGARVTGTMSGVIHGDGLGGAGANYKFAFEFSLNERVRGVYALRDERWSLVEVVFTTTSWHGVFPTGPDVSIMSQSLSAEFNRAGPRGKTRTFGPETSSTIIRTLRSAESE